MAYRSKKVYLGIDVHKRTYSVIALCQGEIVKRDRMRAEPEALASCLKKHFKGARITTVYEAGFSGFALHRVLLGAGIANIVVNPGSLEVAVNDRVKTDRRDSLKLAEQLNMERLKGIYIPSESEEQNRALSRSREQIVEQRKRVSNQLKSKLHYFGGRRHKKLRIRALKTC